MKKLVITVILIGSLFSAYSQQKTIKGRVISDDFEPVRAAPIFINDTVEVGRTDLQGFFTIEIPVSVNKLLFTSAGMEPTNIVLADNCDSVEVVMMLSVTYDFITLKKADRLRKKRFKKLPALHKQALAKHIFTTDTVCYTQEFNHYYKKTQK